MIYFTMLQGNNIYLAKKKIKNILNMRQMSQLKNCVENYIIP